ncbi:MAG: YciI family protein [Dokdonella sp.]|uniref:YciI family protein n=1 Tax=Dokdonella sp. TaxID=2291710 RepID=UPI00326454C5
MTLYLISFNDGAMTFPDAQLHEVAKAAHAVIQQAKEADVFVFGGGLGDPADARVVSTDGTVNDLPVPGRRDFIGGFTVVDVSSRSVALEWAAKIAAACRCPQEVRAFSADPNR